MIMMIGFVTMGALVGLLAFCMANESDAEKRRSISSIEGSAPPADTGGEVITRQAA